MNAQRTRLADRTRRKPAMHTALRVASAIDRLTTTTAHLVRWGLLLNALLIAGNAFLRKFFALGWPLLYDLQWHFFAAAVMLMAAYTLQRDEHVRVDVLASRFGERGMAWLDLTGTVLVLIPLCLVVAWVTLPPFWHALLAGETRSTRESLSDLPAWIIKGFVPAGFLLLALQGMAEAIRCVAALRGVARRPSHRRQSPETDHADA